MYNGRMWLVVKPSVGVPLMLGTVAVVSLIVHYMVLTHTTWYPAFLQGNQKAKTAAMEMVPGAVKSKVSMLGVAGAK